MFKLRTRSWQVTILTGALILSSSGCTVPASADRTGTLATPSPTTLLMAIPNGQEEILSYADAVAEHSGGTLEVEMLSRDATAKAAGLTGREILDAVRNGDVQLAALPVRDLDALGVDALDPLIAPLLIDSLALEAEVLNDSDLVASMIDQVDGLGAVTVGVLPGPLQYPHGITRDLTDPRTFQGASITISPGELAADAISGLGAAPTTSEFNGAAVGTDGLVLQLAAIVGNSYHKLGGSIAVDAPLWPRPFLVIANEETFDALAEPVQQALRGATTDVVERVIAQQVSDDAAAISMICTSGLLRLIEAGPDGRAALEHAVGPLIAAMRSDPVDASVIDRIQALRSQVDPERLPSCSTGEPRKKSSRLDGTYVADTTAEDLRRQGVPEGAIVEENWGHLVLVVKGSRFALTMENESACTYFFGRWSVDDQVVRMTTEGSGGIAPNNATAAPGEDYRFRWTEFDGQLQLTYPGPEDGPPDVTVTRLSDSADVTAFPQRCAPPASAFTTD